jgi:hypothetical protein
MKTYFNILVALILSFTAFSQNTAIDKYFSAYENNADFTVVFVSPKMFKMIANATNDSKNEITDLVKDIQGLKILSTEKDALKYYTEAVKKIPLGEYEVLMTVKDKGENVKFLTKGSGDVVDELLLLVGGGKNFVLMSFVGKLDLNKIAKLANKLDIQGSEHLGKLKDKK